MKNRRTLPDWLVLWLWRALLGEIYPNIRAIAVSFSENRELLVRYYLDRQPTEADYKNLDYVMTNVMAETSSDNDIKKEIQECEYSILPMGELDKLDGFIYARREYDV